MTDTNTQWKIENLEALRIQAALAGPSLAAMQAYINGLEFELRAALAQQAEQTGWVWVPVIATPEMIAAGDEVEDLYRRGTPDTWGAVYRAMLAAAPKGGV